MLTQKPDAPVVQRPGPVKRFFSDELHEYAWPAFLSRPLHRRIFLTLFTAAIVWLDCQTGATIRFPAYYAIPILLFAWYDGFVWGSAVGIAIVAVRLGMEGWLWSSVPWPFEHSLINARSSIAMMLVVNWFTARAGRLTREVRLLWGLLPICMYCHRIRNESNQWKVLELYLAERSKVAFTHGICPSCESLKYP